ncbi:MAG: hypothetical protein AAF333_15350 [Planctomycetota bacterium]
MLYLLSKDHLSTPHSSRHATRMVWWYLVVCQFSFLVMYALGVTGVLNPPTRPGPNYFADFTAATGLVVLSVSIPAGLFIRNQIYKYHWHGHAVAPFGFFLGNIVLYGLLHVPAFIALSAVIFGKPVMAGLIPFGIAMAVHLINFPHGRAMQPQEPRLGR